MTSSAVLLFLSAVSVAGFVATLIAIPVILVRLPPHYFDPCHPRAWFNDRHPLLRMVGLGLKNLLGVVFILGGAAMLVLPGQGILTILIGLSLVDFPGKMKLECKLVSQPLVLDAINGLRRRFDRPPLVVTPSE